jgi:hypothetical protein
MQRRLSQVVASDSRAASAIDREDLDRWVGSSTIKTTAMSGMVTTRSNEKRVDHKSMTMSPVGCEQHKRRLPPAGWSSGSGAYATSPETRPLSQV